MLNIRMNEVAVRALEPGGLAGATPVAELAPELREVLDEGIVRAGPALVFARRATRAHAPHAATEDLTAWECATNEIHLDDVVPVDVGCLEDGEPVISEADQVRMSRHGLGFALEVVRLVRALPEPVAVRCIVGANSTNGTFRFHRARPGESWLGPDVDGFLGDKLIVVDSGPASLGGTPW
ncbi:MULTISPECIES: hypothetical protein [Actinoalloteichus]|uniref:Uncharacterized protein n=1 Tax=Actinoalloteichus caeruleus DSM 43889 TaxID=1120930 RepID=A0ABT1JGR1_ACTCY|nr:hypothetical protein [Actinoalloteichus caeruleus]MCP2331672.1 hypothetical protein [Actinoalloteichus caeruleus DSM 43889]